jgi:hypothetical protein
VRRYLVVANQTLGGEPLTEEIRRRLREGPCRFHVLVPATPADYLATVGYIVESPFAPLVVHPRDLEGLPSEDEGRRQAQERLDRTLEQFRGCGVEAAGEVGHPDPLTAVADVLERQEVDEIIVSTLPSRLSRWLRMDLPTRVERKFGLPVSLVTPD